MDADGFATHINELDSLERNKMMIPMPGAYPELRSTVDEVKERLHSYGVLTFPTFDIPRNLYAIAHSSVDVLYEVADHIGAASLDERKMWNEIFCYGKNHHSVLPNGKIKGNRDYAAYYRRMMDCQGTLLRVVAATDESNPQLRPAKISEDADIMMIASGLPVDDHASYRAALIIIGATNGFPPSEVPVEDIEFIAVNIDAIEAFVLDELMLRGTADRALVQEILSNASALANGSL